ncbi:hypothetical protein AWZ03_003187 [Drosophila navojoa]|uniref:Uncharacterized protein n=1 Tax=Drosophila navojoa TaxID=7232 RepID=A0A484BPY9_DRONA|nr:hypothetical protein AWZ03_003187 [Drosophila navojoa]
MAAYTQFGYGGFPSASQLLPPNVTQTPEDVSANVNASSLVMTNAPALSPTGGADCQASQQQPGGGGGGGGGGPGSGTGAGRGGAGGGGGGDASTGALSPDALSQNSNAATGSAVAGAVAGPDAITGGSLDSSAVGTTPTTGSSCCENGRPIMTDPVSGQTVCSCQYDSARLALSSYSRLPAASVGVYGSPYPSTDQNPYQSIGVDSSAFYSPLRADVAKELKQNSRATDVDDAQFEFKGKGIPYTRIPYTREPEREPELELELELQLELQL